MNLLPQVWQTSSGTWRDLTSALLRLPYYPYMFLAPNGQVFNAGPGQTTRYLDTSGSGAWTVVGDNTFGTRNWGSAAMYDDGKVLIMGGIRGLLRGRIRRGPHQHGGNDRLDRRGLPPGLPSHPWLIHANTTTPRFCRMARCS